MSRKSLGLIMLSGTGLLIAAMYHANPFTPAATAAAPPLMLIGSAQAAEGPAVAKPLVALPPAAPGTPATASPLVSPLPAAMNGPGPADLQKPPSDPNSQADANGGKARGVVRAVNEATLSSSMVAQITQMNFSEGTAFKKGDLLVAFNCDRAQADLRAAQAGLQVEQKTVETNQELEHFNSVGKFDVLISQSKRNKAKAEVEALQAQIKECKVYAPFDGRVIERMKHVHESVAVSEAMLKIVDTSKLELDLIVPSKWLQWLKPGSPFTFAVDETGKSSGAVVDRLLPEVDPVSKTLKIIGRFNSSDNGQTIPGMSGTATFKAGG
ncbi:efflux RND transporter periplasmic adaptor subunit [Pseudomonas sp. MWU16-30317]|uniref:efflux RND transporter periplasmic adaptor subunit n=1 Tax=Pseudomonas sp. MWU16-30317 TaxID=2878095 RepID=UPI001CFB1142|nr:efflux RND transporter periplasmic adaptor subunit [Pseudomonas sp. MWU16-30317]